jgi:hypothetical protein
MEMEDSRGGRDKASKAEREASKTERKELVVEEVKSQLTFLPQHHLTDLP